MGASGQRRRGGAARAQRRTASEQQREAPQGCASLSVAFARTRADSEQPMRARACAASRTLATLAPTAALAMCTGKLRSATDCKPCHRRASYGYAPDVFISCRSSSSWAAMTLFGLRDRKSLQAARLVSKSATRWRRWRAHEREETTHASLPLSPLRTHSCPAATHSPALTYSSTRLRASHRSTKRVAWRCAPARISSSTNGSYPIGDFLLLANESSASQSRSEMSARSLRYQKLCAAHG